MRGDLFFFLGIFLLIFVVWVASGGPERPISFAGPYLNPISNTGTTASAYGDPSKFSSINSNVTVGLGGVTATARTSGNTGKVALSRDLSGVASTDPKSEYIVINVYAGGENVSTAGWKLVSSANGDGAALPQGTETAKSGRINTLAPITLRPGDQAIVVTGRSPVGVSFRENKCTGYLEEHQDFSPSLSMSCPTASQEFSRFYTGNDQNDECLSYVRSIAYCSTEAYSGTENVSSSCESFVEEHLNYNSCVATHETDSDFGGNVWRVFLGQSDELWRRDRETITLYDAENKVIDSLTY